MSNSISSNSYTPPPEEETPPPTTDTRTDPAKADSFQRMLRKKGDTTPLSKEEMEQMTQEEVGSDDPNASLFDLSKKAQGKSALGKKLSRENQAESKNESLSDASQTNAKEDIDQPLQAVSERDAQPEDADEFKFEHIAKVLGKTEPDSSENAKLAKPLQEGPEAKADPSKMQPASDQTRAASEQVRQAGVEKKGRESDTQNVKETKDSGKKEKKGGSTAEVSSNTADGIPSAFTPIQGVGMGLEKSQFEDKQSLASTIADLANQVVESIEVIKKEGSLDTVITLRHPAILAGSTMTLTAFNDVKNEFNLSFTNLTKEAKLFLDQKLAENALSENLEQKGIVVHITVTSTEPSPQNRQQDREQQQQQQRERQREQENEPEG